METHKGRCNSFCKQGEKELPENLADFTVAPLPGPKTSLISLAPQPPDSLALNSSLPAIPDFFPPVISNGCSFLFILISKQDYMNETFSELGENRDF